MPVHYPIPLGHRDFHQAAATRPVGAGAGGGLVDRTMGAAQQPAAAVVEEAIGLPVHLHRHVGATVEIGVGPSLIADGEGTAGLAGENDVERDGHATFAKVGRLAERDRFRHACASAFCKSQSCRPPTESATNSGFRLPKSAGSCAP